jgi:hypothetical protein
LLKRSKKRFSCGIKIWNQLNMRTILFNFAPDGAGPV